MTIETSFYSMPTKKVHGIMALTLPLGFIVAKNRGEQLDILYEVADDPKTTRDHSERLLRVVKYLMR